MARDSASSEKDEFATASTRRFLTVPAMRSRTSEASFPISPLAMLNVSASGIEAQHVLADAITTKAVERGRIHYREAWLYFESRITGMTYILTASPELVEGHDVADYLERFDEACTRPCVAATRKYVQRRALLALGDPLLYYAIYGFAGVVHRGRKHNGPFAAHSGWKRDSDVAFAGFCARAVRH